MSDEEAAVAGGETGMRGDAPRTRWSRRTVLRTAALTAVAAVTAGGALAALRGAENGAFGDGGDAAFELWSSWDDQPGLLRVAAAGVLAANPHDMQPWSLVVGEHDIEVYDDPTRAMPVNDPDGRERAVGHGCAIQNMIVAARAAGLDTGLDLFPRGSSAVARLEFAKGSAPSASECRLAAAIGSRHTDRGPFSGRGLSAPQLEALAAGAPASAEVRWVSAQEPRAALGELYVQATQAIVADRDMSVESASWFRSARSEVNRHRDGLILDCQGLDAPTLAAAKILPAQSRSSADAHWVRATREVHTATAQAYGVIRVADSSDPVSRVDGGRLLQQVHLAATVAGLGLHHMNQITERIDRDRHQDIAPRFAQQWSDLVEIPEREGLVSFRLGYPARPGHPSPRRDLDDIIRRVG